MYNYVYIYVCVYLYDRGQTDKNTGQNGDELQYQLKMNLPGFWDRPNDEPHTNDDWNLCPGFSMI